MTLLPKKELQKLVKHLNNTQLIYEYSREYNRLDLGQKSLAEEVLKAELLKRMVKSK